MFCPANTFKLTKEKATSCTKCPDGATSRFGSSRCSCKLGQFWSTNNDCFWCYKYPTFCKPCPSGTYKTEVMPTCRVCPTRSTSTAGSNYCACDGGWFWNGSSCEQCSEGSISQVGATTCLSCPSQSRQEGSLCACPPGEKWTWENSISGSCRPCSPGYYSELGALCEMCPSGATSLVGSERCVCPAGKFWSIDSSSCEDCEVQFVSRAGSLRCQLCPSGSTANLRQTLCTCPFDKEWNWNEYGPGSCELVSGSDTPILAIVSVVLTIICISLVAFLIIERGKKPGQRNTLTRVVYNRGAEIVDDQQIPAIEIITSQYEDVDLKYNQDVNPHQAEDHRITGESESVPFSDKGKRNAEVLYSVPWLRSAPGEDDVYDTLNRGTAPQYHTDRPRQMEEDDGYCVLGNTAAGTAVLWRQSTLAEEEKDGVSVTGSE